MPLPQADQRRRSANYWLWMLVVVMASLTLALVAGNMTAPAEKRIDRDTLGQDFLAFYSAGRIVNADATSDLYDLAALSQWQTQIAKESGLTPAAAVAPWWNPPLVAWVFAPLARLSFHQALAMWWAISGVCLLAAAAIGMGWIREVSSRRREWLLVAAALAVAPPTLQALGHGQNTTVSLLILAITVVAWRDRRPLIAGLACSFLFYKPQLAAIVSLGLIATLGWRVMIGLMLGMVPQALLTLATMPGAMTLFLERVPDNLRIIQTEQAYLWHRHATFIGFWRHLLQGNAAAPTAIWITTLAYLSMATIGTMLARAAWQVRSRLHDDVTFDRLIAATILATPLLMPFFFDYDLLLLAIPAILIARDMLLVEDHSTEAKLFRFIGGFTFLWLAANPVTAEMFGINLTVPLLAVLLILQLRRCTRSEAIATRSLPLPEVTASRLAA